MCLGCGGNTGLIGGCEVGKGDRASFRGCGRILGKGFLHSAQQWLLAPRGRAVYVGKEMVGGKTEKKGGQGEIVGLAGHTLRLPTQGGERMGGGI